MSDTV